ncbi:hypothetical protein RvY_19444 [Ramazzottius varieornatus]|uniref:Glucuronosyltransferase n=1 Tax=Ramazzottius varieornatus TaxID=947166 RepID=A0A1D1W9D4_RAMVA|nr:hypothetical protein RvY_19444 [Ramazzottius varieornatus]
MAGQDQNQSNIKPWDGSAVFFELRPLDGPQAPMPDKLLALLRVVWEELHCAGALILNSHWEAEAALVAEIEKRVNAEVICCGPLIPSVKCSDRTTEDSGAIQWLDLQKAGSVIYIGFGSLVTPAPEQLREIAKALIILKKPFLWSLKPVFHEHLASELACKESRGKVCSWVPQQEVLMHKSVGLVLHHGGWGATQQTLTAGKPALVWPMASDEKMAAKYLVEKGAALMMEGTGVSAERLVQAEEIVKALVDVETTCKEGAESWGRKLRISLEDGGASQIELERLANLVTKVCCS